MLICNVENDCLHRCLLLKPKLSGLLAYLVFSDDLAQTRIPLANPAIELRYSHCYSYILFTNVKKRKLRVLCSISLRRQYQNCKETQDLIKNILIFSEKTRTCFHASEHALRLPLTYCNTGSPIVLLRHITSFFKHTFVVGL